MRVKVKDFCIGTALAYFSCFFCTSNSTVVAVRSFIGVATLSQLGMRLSYGLGSQLRRHTVQEFAGEKPGNPELLHCSISRSIYGCSASSASLTPMLVVRPQKQLASARTGQSSSRFRFGGQPSGIASCQGGPSGCIQLCLRSHSSEPRGRQRVFRGFSEPYRSPNQHASL